MSKLPARKKTLIFDLGGVLLDWDPRYLYRKVFDDRVEMEYFLEKVCSPEWNAQMDTARPFQDAIDELIPRYPQYAEPIQMYYSRWYEMMGGDFPETVNILRQLKEAGYPLAALSNWSGETFPRVRKEHRFLDWFDPLVLSFQLGVAKPHPEIYQALLKELGEQARDCLFIDDSDENVQEAKRQGFSTIHFQSPAGLREALSEMGLL